MASRVNCARIMALYALLIAFNVAAWVWALIAFQHFPLLLGTAFLAYCFGLRHAVDADHIAAIDTATEVGVLCIFAAAGGNRLPIRSIMVFPALFTAGMSVVETTAGILMLGAYGWAFIKPVRKLDYNMTITFVSVVVALLVGGIEALGLVANQFNLSGSFWNAIGRLNDHFGVLGFLVIGIFVLSWAIAALIYRLKRYDELDAAVTARATE